MWSIISAFSVFGDSFGGLCLLREPWHGLIPQASFLTKQCLGNESSLNSALRCETWLYLVLDSLPIFTFWGRATTSGLCYTSSICSENSRSKISLLKYTVRQPIRYGGRLPVKPPCPAHARQTVTMPDLGVRSALSFSALTSNLVSLS